MTRAAWNKRMDVYDGPDLGGALRLANIQCRKVLRDESGGIVPSPPFGAWITCPITNVLRGCQTDPLSAFDVGIGDRLWDTNTGLFLGVVLWAETWLPGTVNNYQRVYVLNYDPRDELAFNLVLELEDDSNQPPANERALELAITLDEYGIPPPAIDLYAELVVEMEDAGATPPPDETGLDLLLLLVDSFEYPPLDELTFDLVAELDEHGVPPPADERGFDLVAELDEHGVPPPAVDLAGELVVELDEHGVPPPAVDLAGELVVELDEHGVPPPAVDLAGELVVEMEDFGSPIYAVDLYAELVLEMDEISGGGSITTNCCANPIPTTLYLNLNGSGCCGGITAFTLTYDAAGADGAGWYSPVNACGGNAQYWFLECVGAGPGWNLKLRCGAGQDNGGASATTCSPFLLSIGLALATSCCALNNTTATITE